MKGQNHYKPLKSGVFLKQIQMIHLALLAGMTIATIFAANLDILNLDWASLDFTTVTYNELLIPIGAIVLSYITAKKMLKKHLNDTSLKKSVSYYQTVFIIQASILEFNYFILIFKMKTVTAGSLAGLALILLYFISLRPTKSKIIRDLQLDTSDANQFNDGNEYLT